MWTGRDVCARGIVVTQLVPNRVRPPLRRFVVGDGHVVVVVAVLLRLPALRLTSLRQPREGTVLGVQLCVHVLLGGTRECFGETLFKVFA